jgi:hypothetical protein
MRIFGIIHIVLFILLMIFYQCIHAQDYVVLTKGDTIEGTLKPLTFGPDKKLQVVETGKKKVTYPLFQVKSFSMDGETYIPAKGPTGYTFMKVLKPGFLSLLAFQLENQFSYDGRFLLKKNGEGIEVPNLSFKKALKNFLDDCGDVSQKIEAGTYAKKELDIIIDEYNGCVEGNQAIKNQTIAQQANVTQKLNPWDALEAKVKASQDFEGKKDGLEMITEIKGKISRGEKVPNFLIEGLKSALNGEELQPALQEALAQLN